jgi:hypothetical protein
LRPSRRRKRINRRIVLGGHNGRGLFACPAGTISILLLKHSPLRFLLLIVIHCQQRASAMVVG